MGFAAFCYRRSDFILNRKERNHGLLKIVH